MKILRLSSSDSRFEAIEFKNGLNIIVGEKVLKDDKKKTSNGIGKSLALICIDFLLGKGAQSKEVSKLKKILEDQKIVLTLLFEHNGETYKVDRSHNKICFNDIEYKKESEYIEFLDSLISVKYSFRDIFSRFFRTNKESYQDAIYQVTTKEKAYKNNLINAFLLRLDLEYLNKKKELKEKSDRLKTLISEFGKLQKEIDKEKEFELTEKLSKIEKDLESFEIAEDFNQLKQEADILTEEIRNRRNKIAYSKREIRSKKRIIEVNKQVDIDIEKLNEIYAEANFFLPKSAIKHLEAVQAFHETLFENRKNRAKKDIEKLKKEVHILNEELKIKDIRRSKIFKYLENKGALEEYHVLTKEKEVLQEALNEIKRKEKLLKEFKKEQADIELEIDKFKKELIDLEDTLSTKIKQLGQMFRSISEEHYNDKPGYLDIEIIEKFNTEKLYKIEPEIKGDGSDGINEMKIFIYDMLIYKLNPDLIGLVGHDNRLFDMVDERQIARAFEYVNKNLKQYICSIGDTKFNGAKELSALNLEQFKILTLSEKNKLFGFDFD
ncbi:MAG: DUF2326 domain-containing protein [Sulfurovum sp.]|nr:DUF2326 domain-containing protein [Sulfurovum sp.]MCB4759141.1 DUF2326 domain-containing protein [Sulfurovum sp.]MCB4763115.1 DUF2326 domain-containing protein [Sulfurovum sp.]MCB4765166.1 DUF2326 domain-containing protein [Sulfurovum sp.]MCB4766205.1 DUF2326 domain-containing protein [Sulfurovum sp.]